MPSENKIIEKSHDHFSSVGDAMARYVSAFERERAKPHYGIMDVTNPDRTCLSWWFPKLVQAGLPVPETRYIAVNHARLIGEEMYENHGQSVSRPMAEMLCGLAMDDQIGFPCFLRTGHFSGKHDWRRTCFVESPDHMLGNMASLAVMQECCGCHPPNNLSVWVVRRILPTKTIVRCEGYGGFPLTREIRVFVEDGHVAYTAPYWPDGAIEQGKPEHNEWSLDSVQSFTDEELADVTALAAKAGEACGGRWSVDVLDTEEGWYVTDLAIAESSYGFDAERFDR